MSQACKALLIGMDAAVPRRWRKLAEAGLLPVGQRLLAEGCFAARCLPALPTLTTTNWATIGTGAMPATHGITDFNPHRVGELPGQSLQGFDSRDVQAEFVWESAVRAGLDAIVVNWPGSWPPRAPRVAGGGQVPSGKLVILGGAGIELNEWRIGLPRMERLVALAAEQRFSTLDEPGSSRIAPLDGGAFDLPFAFRLSHEPVSSALSLTCQVVEDAGRPVARFWLTGAQEATLAELAPGEWSERLTLPFQVDGRQVPASFRLKLLDLDPASGLFRLYVSDICRLTWLERPEGVQGETTGFAGLATPGSGWDAYTAGFLDLDTFVELIDMSTAWLADVCVDVLDRNPCDLLCVHFHAADSFYHLCAEGLDERATPDAVERRRFEAAELDVYRRLDEAMGRILARAGDPELTVLVSDHGVTPPGPDVPLRRILSDAGLLKILDAQENGPANLDGIDWARTLASPQGSCFVRVNLAGREPSGVVPEADLGSVVEQVMKAMLDYRDPVTGRCPFTLVLPKAEAAVIGVGGDGAGDVVYAVLPELADVHGPIMPDATLSPGQWGMAGLCLFSGPAARAGVTLDETMSLADVAPTVCRALGIPAPAQCDGQPRTGLLASRSRPQRNGSG